MNKLTFSASALAIVALSGVVVKLTRDYTAQRRMGREPRFHIAAHPDLAGRGVDETIWR